MTCMLDETSPFYTLYHTRSMVLTPQIEVVNSSDKIGKPLLPFEDFKTLE